MPTRQSGESERLRATRRADAHAESAEHTAPQHPLLNLQRQFGNAHVQRLLAQRETLPEEEEQLQLRRDPGLQRETLPEEEEPLQLQREAAPQVGPQGGPVSDQVATRIEAQRGDGSPLESQTRQEMESAFGANFEGVRVHMNEESHQLNRNLGAQAFTTGNDIFFGPSGNPNDRQLLAHELTHVLQQQSMSGASGPLTVGPADDVHEQQAEATARRIAP